MDQKDCAGKRGVGVQGIVLVIFISILCFSVFAIGYDVVEDDCVDTKDLAQVSKCYGSDVSGECSNADLDGDGDIDSDDYDLVYLKYEEGLQNPAPGCAGYSCSVEVCDGIDNDCDGVVDDGFDNDADGYTSCNGDCNDEDSLIHPGVFDDCDGIDNDCDGSVDEDYVPVSTSTTCGVGACASTGSMACKEGVVVDTCIPGNPAESDSVCDGIDDDCDGSVDEDYVSVSTKCGTGACISTGELICKDGSVVDTCVAVEESEEICDGIDNDCDDFVDEDFSGLGDACSEGLGACFSEGTYVCTADGLGVECNAVAGRASAEICDGIDNDCDGSVDEGLPDSDNDGLSDCIDEDDDNDGVLDEDDDCPRTPYYEFANAKGCSCSQVTCDYGCQDGVCETEECVTLFNPRNDESVLNVDFSRGFVEDGVNLFTGKLDKTIDIGTFSGLNGLDLVLQMNYNPGFNSEYSMLGKGWDMIFGYLYKSKKENNFFLVLSEGAQKLIGALKYNTEIYNGLDIVDDSLGGWSATDKTGIRYDFDYVLEDSKYFVWYLSKISDPFGNSISFDYKTDYSYKEGNCIKNAYVESITDSVGRELSFKKSKVNDSGILKLDQISVSDPEGSENMIYKFGYSDLDNGLYLTYLTQMSADMKDSRLVNAFRYDYGLLKEQWNEMGGKTSFDYNGSILSSKKEDDGIGNVYETRYVFEGFKNNSDGRGGYGNSGFETAEIYYPDDSGSVEYNFLTVYPTYGFIDSKNFKDNDGNVVRSEKNDWFVSTSTSSAYKNFITGSFVDIPDNQEVFDNYDSSDLVYEDSGLESITGYGSRRRSSGPTYTSCVDPDNEGSSYYWGYTPTTTYGIVTAVDNTGKNYIFEDECTNWKSESGSYWGGYEGEVAFRSVSERYCSGTKPSTRTINCEYKCVNGACCKEGECPPEDYSCTDSDGGYFYDNKGTVTYVDSYSGETKTVEDHCEGNYLVEYTCRSWGDDFTKSSTYHFCKNGCYDGACCTEQGCELKVVCKDSDNGLDYYTAGTVTGNSYWGGEIYYKDECRYYDYLDHDQVVEFYCNSPYESPVSSTKDCTLGCVDGACIKAIYCEDSDGGKNFDQAGDVKLVTSQGESILSDECASGSMVKEYYCDGSSADFKYSNCRNTCENGECMPPGECIGPTSLDNNIKQEIFMNYSDGRSLFKEDYCEGDYAVKYYCSWVRSSYSTNKYYCSNGCVDGVCVTSHRVLPAKEEINIGDYEHVTEYAYDYYGHESRRVEKDGNFYKDTQRVYNGDLLKDMKIYDSSVLLSDVSYEWDTSKRKVIEKIEKDGDDERVTKYDHDSSGNLISLENPAGYEYNYEYDDMGNLVEESYEGEIISKNTYYPDGSLESETDGNGLTVYYNYDGLGRLLTAGSSKLNADILYSYSPNSMLMANSNALGGTALIESYDGIGRLIKTEEDQGDGFKLIQNYEYDAFGNLVSVSEKYKVSIYDDDSYVPEKYTNYSYTNDPFRRVDMLINPDGSIVDYSYDDNKVIVESDDETSVQVVGTEGLVFSLEKNNDLDGNVTYKYDILGNLIRIDSDKGTVKFSYDLFDQLKKINTPSGDYNYEYDLSGNKISSVLSSGKSEEFEYDKFNNLLSESLDNITFREYIYDGPSLKKAISNDRSTGEFRMAFDYNYNDLGGIANMFIVDEDGNPLLEGVEFNPDSWDDIDVPISREVCDGLDNDYDGYVDQKVWDAPLCEKQLGVCLGWTESCGFDQSSGGICNYELIRNYESVESSCDGVDNDCDGAVDEGCSCEIGQVVKCGLEKGACSQGVQLCEGGKWSETCTGLTLPTVEVCDSVDNDCDGIVDEYLLNACGECGLVPVEICDGIDNDCDGMVDEGVC